MRLKTESDNSVTSSVSSNHGKEVFLPISSSLTFSKDESKKEPDMEDATRSAMTLIERDRVREYLEKNPSDRTEKDIQFLLDFMQHMPAFSNMTMSMKRSLCRVMVFAVVEKAGTVVLRDGEKLDSWSVILNGHVEVAKQDGTIQHLHMGDSFGVSMTRDTMLQEGVMTTKSDDCQFVCIPQEDFYDILHKEKENIIRIQDASGEVVMVMEKRECEERGNFIQGRIVLRGSPEMLMKQLTEDSTADETYTADFLLTHRTFMKSPADLADYLLLCLKSQSVDKAIQVMHVWLLNHFGDFETNVELFGRLETFFDVLKEKNMHQQVALLQGTCSERARMRQVLLVLKNDEEPLQFILAGGQEKESKIFVSHVDERSPASKAGLRVADQIISVNNHNLDGITLEKAYEFLQMTNHLMITVKSNLLDFDKLKMKTSSSRDHSSPTSSEATHVTAKDVPESGRGRFQPRDQDGGVSSSDLSPLRSAKRFDQSPQGSRLRQALGKMNLMQKSETCENYTGFRNSISSASAVLDNFSSWSASSWNQSVDLQNKPSALCSPCSNKFPLEETSAIAIFRADQSCRYILVKQNTTVQEAIDAALAEFEISRPSGHFSLCQITLDEDGTIKTKHLPNHISELIEKSTLNSRYYLRDIQCMEKLITGDISSSLSADVNFLQLSFSEVASQLTQRDMQLFCSIDPVEYINDLFEIAPVPQLTRFSELVNEEMFWVVTEVCSEQNCLKRSKILKQFIKIAERCHKLKNFNSMFAILSGLGHGSVSRLRQTWEKLPDKYNKLFEEMQGVMDPSRNMLKYRNLLLSSQPPLIPFFPLVKKDLTFIHFGNDSRIDGLINFDKLRMISKEIRLIYKMASASSDKFIPTKNSMESLTSCGSSSSLMSVTPKKFAPSFASSASLTTPSTGLVALNAKKLYEEGQSSRTVKTYISCLKIISDENKLSAMSHLCEPNGKSRKAASSSLPAPLPLLKCEINGPRFGSENPSAIFKLMSLSEGVKPTSSDVNKVSSIPASSSKSSSSACKNKAKHQLSPLVLSQESSSVSIFSKKKNPADQFKVVALKKKPRVTPTTNSSGSNSSLSLSSSSSSIDVKGQSDPRLKISHTSTISPLPLQSSSSSSSSSGASHVHGDNTSSSTSSGICSLESASSLHHQDATHENCYDIITDDDLENLPDDEVDDEDDDDNCDGPITARSSCPGDLPFISENGSCRTLCHSDSSTLRFKRHSIDIDLNSNSSKTTSTLFDPKSNGSPSGLGSSTDDLHVSIAPIMKSQLSQEVKNSSIQTHHLEEQVENHLHYHPRSSVISSSSSSPYSFPNSPRSLIPPSYEELLLIKQNVPSRCSPNFQYSPQLPSSIPAHLGAPQISVRMHSKCCCCSVCFQSSYHHLHHHQRLQSMQTHSNVPSGPVFMHRIDSLHVPSIHQVKRYSQQGLPNVIHHRPHKLRHNQQLPFHSLVPADRMILRSHGMADQMRLNIPWKQATYYPYATVCEDDDNELVTLV